MTQPRYSICITELATEMPRCFSISIQSEVACRALLRALTVPAIWIAPEKSSSFSVSVVLPASGCEIMAKVLRRATSRAICDWLIGVHYCDAQRGLAVERALHAVAFQPEVGGKRLRGVHVVVHDEHAPPRRRRRRRGGGAFELHCRRR